MSETMTVTGDGGSSSNGGGVHWGGGGNTGNNDKNNSSSQNMTFAEKQVSGIMNDANILKKIQDLIKKAKLINPNAVLTPEAVFEDGRISISISGMSESEVSKLGVSITAIRANGQYFPSAILQTNYKLPKYANDSSNLDAKKVKDSQLGIYMSILNGKIPAGFWLKNNKVMTKVAKKEAMTAGGKGGGVRYVTIYRDQEIAVLTDAWKKSEALKKELQAKAKAKAEAEAKKKAEEAAVKDAVKFTTDFYKEVLKVHGAKAEQLAKLLANQAKGKKFSNAEAALKAYAKYQGNINKKINAKDRAAIAKALESRNVNDIAKKVTKLSKGLGYVGVTMDVVDAYNELVKAVKTDNWRAFYVKVQTIAVGYAATEMAALAFGAILGGPIGLLGYGLIIAGIGALVNEKVVDEANKIIGV
ncbi:BREX system ATP-binding domain-containing protein [Klebsiella oxytoca]|uniref:colicin-like pore-forming protein n=1 Tax=Klebsiella oxytoca TaxID=571 RepID=UPI0025508B8D|nr:BREX system ATP-binding domain-containing protein [Klebsiella oxytoca]MEC5509944.1 BREX system ATP-binding domain-containing protein [Klebsiella oxytoca]